MELGVSEEYAHKLATDRNMTDIKNMTHDDVASTLGISKDAEEFINTMQIIAEQGSRRRAAKKSTKITIRAKAIDDIDRPEITSRFNALNHELVPHQELVGDANISPDEQLAVEMEARTVENDASRPRNRRRPPRQGTPSQNSHHRPRRSGDQRTR